MSKTDYERLADVMEAYAMVNTVPPGTRLVGATFSGWPLDTLAAEVCGPNAPLNSTVQSAISLIQTRHSVRQHNAAAGIAGQTISRAPPRLPSLAEMLAMRMRWDISGATPFDRVAGETGFQHIDMHRVGDKVHVWIITRDAQSTVLEDDYSLFPSDALITKLNMLKQG